jgi:hypothetical protein
MELEKLQSGWDDLNKQINEVSENLNKILHMGKEDSFSDNCDKLIELETKYNQLLYEARANGFELGEDDIWRKYR